MSFYAIPIAAAALLAGLANGQGGSQSVWGQCGGLQYSGPTNCAQGNYCSYGNDYYYQCVPGTAVQDSPLGEETDTPDEGEGEGGEEEEPPAEGEEEPETTPIQIIPTRTSYRGPFPTVTRTIFNPNPTAPTRGGGSASVIVIGGRTYSLVVPAPTAGPEKEEGEPEEGDESENNGVDGTPAGKGTGSAAGAVKRRRFMAR